ncbi:PucR family transcriptional regulator [Gordonia terrae]
MCSEATVTQIRTIIGQNAVDWAVKLAADLARDDPVTRSLGLERGPNLAAAQRLGAEAGFLRILTYLYLGEVAPPYLAADEHRYIEDLIERRVTLSQLLTQVRHGHAHIADRLMSACRELVPLGEQSGQLQLISRILFKYIDGLVTEAGPVFEQAERTWHASLFAVRANALHRVLQENATDLDELSTRLGYDLAHRYHVAIAVYAAAAEESDSDLADAAKQALTEAGATQTLIIPRGLVHLWAWGNSTTPLNADAISEPNGLSMTVGQVSHGVDGFRRSHQQALETNRIEQLYRGPTCPLRHFDDVHVLSLLLAEPNRAKTFVENVLGDLARNDPKTADLRLTVRSFYESRGPNETAAKLHVARNTVTYRLRRATELLGRPVDERQLETWSALLLYDFTLRQVPTD